MSSLLLKKVNKFADRGAVAEKAVQKYLTDWAQHTHREFERLVDSKAAGRTIKAAAADFAFFAKLENCGPHGDATYRYHGLIEVKETKHAFRLEKKRVTQLARLRKRTNAGGLCLVLVFHSETSQWRCIDVPYMVAGGDLTGSWDMSSQPVFTSVGAALHRAVPHLF